MARREHPRYENHEWREWEFREYPMMIYPGAPDPRKPVYEVRRGRNVLKHAGVIVKNDDELEGVLNGTLEIDSASGEIVSAEDTRLALIRECEIQGLKIDKSWTVDKLQKALDASAQSSEEVV